MMTATPNGRVLFEMQQILDMHDPLVRWFILIWILFKKWMLRENITDKWICFYVAQVNSAEGSYQEEDAMPSIAERFGRTL